MNHPVTVNQETILLPESRLVLGYESRFIGQKQSKTAYYTDTRTHLDGIKKTSEKDREDAFKSAVMMRHVYATTKKDRNETIIARSKDAVKRYDNAIESMKKNKVNLPIFNDLNHDSYFKSYTKK